MVHLFIPGVSNILWWSARLRSWGCQSWYRKQNWLTALRLELAYCITFRTVILNSFWAIFFVTGPQFLDFAEIFESKNSKNACPCPPTVVLVKPYTFIRVGWIGTVLLESVFYAPKMNTNDRFRVKSWSGKNNCSGHIFHNKINIFRIILKITAYFSPISNLKHNQWNLDYFYLWNMYVIISIFSIVQPYTFVVWLFLLKSLAAKFSEEKTRGKNFLYTLPFINLSWLYVT